MRISGGASLCLEAAGTRKTALVPFGLEGLRVREFGDRDGTICA